MVTMEISQLKRVVSYIDGEPITTEKWLTRYARKVYNRRHEKDPRYTKADALGEALDELDDGWGIFIDPTQDEYDDLLHSI